MATKGKAAAKAAPAPVEAAVEEVGFEIGQSLKFVGYAPDVPENEQVLTADEVYVVVDLAEETGNPVVEIENPDFNPKKKEDAEKNPKLVQVECFPEEVEIVEGEEEAAAEEVAETPAPAAKTAPKGKAAVAAKTAPAAKTAAKPAAKTAPAKTAPKGKGKGKAEPVQEPVVEEKEDEYAVDLEGEDEEIIALVESGDDLITTAQEMEAEVGHTEWKLGGLLFHIRKDKKYLEVDGADEAGYGENKGFEAFLKDYFNIEYRKAMYLVQIYVRFTQGQIEAPADVVGRLGWTKAQKVAAAMVNPDANVDELIQLAEANTVKDLSEAIKDQVEVGGTKGEKGEKKTRLTLKFKFFEEEAHTVETILKGIQEELGLKDIGDALLHVLTEYAAENSGGAATEESAPRQAAVAGKPAAKTAPRPPAAKKTAARAAA